MGWWWKEAVLGEWAGGERWEEMGRCWWKEAVLVCVWCWWMTSLEQQLIVTLSAEESQLLSGLERTGYRGGDCAVDLTVVSVNHRRSRDEVNQKTVPYLRPSKKRAETRCGVCCAVLCCCCCAAVALRLACTHTSPLGVSSSCSTSSSSTFPFGCCLNGRGVRTYPSPDFRRLSGVPTGARDVMPSMCALCMCRGRERRV